MHYSFQTTHWQQKIIDKLIMFGKILINRLFIMQSLTILSKVTAADLLAGVENYIGNEYKAASYNRYHHEFRLYNGPSVSKIENQYE